MPRGKPRKKKTPQELEQAKKLRAEKKYRSDIKVLFGNAGFESIAVADKHFNFKGRTGELDNIFVQQNVIVVCEDTYSSSVNAGHHLLKKKVLFDLIASDSADFVKFLIETFPQFNNYCSRFQYKPHNYLVKICYFSRYQLEDEHKAQCPNLFFFDYPLFKYFLSLTKIIGMTSRFELFKYFNIQYSEYGERSLNRTGSGSKNFMGYLLPESNSHYPEGYKVLSFYMDPNTLLEKSYVLRKDSWQDPDSAYQRLLEYKKIKAMRKYLNENQRVYINNLIVTLPASTTFFDPQTNEKLKEQKLTDNQHIKINLPDEFNIIGLIDGQHRAYSYHEGHDSHESQIKSLRTCQNLLVTAIMYPESATELDKTKFEATLFLEINNEQTKARGDLKQAIELIVRPFSTTAISKSVVAGLSKQGPLKGLLEEHYFDDDNKIKTSSIVSYGLKPLLKFGGDDSLMSIWDHPRKASLSEEKDKELLGEYVAFCVKQINNILVGVKIPLANGWSYGEADSVLSPTTINGIIVCLRELILHGKVGNVDYYVEKFEEINTFNFKNYKSSHWKQLGSALYERFFS